MNLLEKHQALLSELRHRYKVKYGYELDDDLLIIIIRLNELDLSISKKISSGQRPELKSKSELLFYSLGKSLTIITLSIMLLNLILLIILIIKLKG